MSSEKARDIAPLPEVVNKKRRRLCQSDFKSFCLTYFPQNFSLPFSEDHLLVIGKIETAVLQGGLFAVAMPRGSGKTTICECACVWSIVYGHRKFVCAIGAEESAGLSILETIKVELETNDLLFEDFPEVCYPIRRLEGIAHRANGQLFNGERTHIRWTNNCLVMPAIPDSVASGSIVRVVGITGRIRGMKFTTSNGLGLRPDLCVIDDPQTDESAKSLSQCDSRERILAGAVLGLAGPGQKISGIMPCTVIRQCDLADRMLDSERHPDWNGVRTKMVYTFPTNEILWDKYSELRADSLQEHGDIRDATEFYRQNRGEMDVGAKVAWAERFNIDEVSAIQHAMNLRYRDEIAFWSEYQNTPLYEKLGTDEIMPAGDICRKLNGLERGDVPIDCGVIVSFIDIHNKLFYWTVVAVDERFTPYLIDYGVYPEQDRRYYSLTDARPSIADIHGDAFEGAMYSALGVVCDALLQKEYERDDGSILRIERCLIDANWGNSTDIVYQFCRQSKYSAILMPSHGRYVGAASVPFGSYKKKPGDKLGLNWRMPGIKGKNAIRHVTFDTNFWKSFFHARLFVGLGNPGCFSLFGRDAAVHQLIAEHLTAEYRVKTEGRGRVVEEWRLRPSVFENHFLDCCVGCMVGASVMGVSLKEMGIVDRPHPPVKLSRVKEHKWQPIFQHKSQTTPAAPKEPGVTRVKLSSIHLKR